MKNPDALQQRLHLIDANRSLFPIVIAKYGGDASELVIILVDVRDSLGRELAQAAIEKAGGLDLVREVARTAARGEIPTAVVVVRMIEARMLFAETHPRVAAGLVTEPPPGRIRVLSIAAGGVVLVHVCARAGWLMAFLSSTMRAEGQMAGSDHDL